MKINFLISVLLMFSSLTAIAQSQEKINSSSLKGVRYFKTVMNGTLYRGGGPGGQRPMQDEGLKTLCEAGFTKAYYLYPNGMNGPKDIQCVSKGKNNTLHYRVSDFRNREAVGQVFKEVREAISNNSGPAYVHCWNGWHASGEISAYALIQFCGYSGDQAAQYWTQNIGDKDKPIYNSIRNRIRKFVPFAEYKVDSGIQNEICPNK